MKRILLSQGKVALVDDGDFEQLNRFKWSVSKRSYGGYAAVRQCRCGLTGQTHTIYMHRQIMSCPQGLEMDHISHNVLDNRRCNLRIVNKSQNQMNSKSKTRSRSKYKGVFWHKRAGRWMAQIKAKGRAVYLGLFDEEVDAAAAYNNAAITLFGPYAYLNMLI